MPQSSKREFWSGPVVALRSGTTQWSSRRLAVALGTDLTDRFAGLAGRAFGLPGAPLNAERGSGLREEGRRYIGRSLNPPDHAAVFCVNQETTIQALDRLDPVLPLLQAGPRLTVLRLPPWNPSYAALNTRSGEILGKTARRHTSTEFVDFLAQVVAFSPSDARSTSSQITSRPIKPD